MRIEVGKTYRAANGERIGPMIIWDGYREVATGDVLFTRSDEDPEYWTRSGKCGEPNTNLTPELDIVAEWSDSPVRTVTRRVIVPGLYGIVAVYREGDRVRVTLTREDGTPDQLEAAARTLQQLAEALRENEGKEKKD